MGIAETKVLAKIANKRAKTLKLKEKCILNLYRSDITAPILKDISVEDVWGIRYRSSLKLKANQILNA